MVESCKGPIVFPLSSSLRSIVVYLLTEPCLVIQSSMFCTLTPQFNQGFCFVFAKKCVGCHIWMLPLHSWCVCTCGSSASHSLRMFPAPDEDHCSESFLFGVDGSVTVLVSQWDRSKKKKKVVIKENLVYLELVRPLLWRQSLDSLKDEFYKA